MRFNMVELHPRRNTMQSVDSLLAEGLLGTVLLTGNLSASLMRFAPTRGGLCVR